MSRPIYMEFDNEVRAFGPVNAQGETEPPQTDWAFLAEGQTLGKKCNIIFTPPAFGVRLETPSPVNILQVQADDSKAHPLCVTLSPPQGVLPPIAGFPADSQGITGTADNIEGLNAPAGSQLVWANPVAVVEWGVGGISNRVECDFLNGLCLNLSASWVRIRAIVESVEATTSLMAYTLGANIGPGNPKPNNAQRTVLPRIGALADGVESPVRPVPRYAKQVYVLGNVPIGQVFIGHIRFYRDNQGPAGIVPCGDLLFTSNDHAPGLIPNGAMYFTVVNNSGAAAGNVTPYAVFDLAI